VTNLGRGISIGRALPIGLLAMAGALLAVVVLEVSGWEQDAPKHSTTARATIAGIDRSLDPPETQNQHEAWLNQILSRPLFSPNRRPVEAGGSRGLPRLTGIVIAGAQRVAIFAGPSNEHPIVAQAGTRIGAYEVQTITDVAVTVAGPEGIISIKPIFDANRPAAQPLQAARVSPPLKPAPK
jgi:hypothetical protein